MTTATARRPRLPHVTLTELAQSCTRCTHQNGGHIGGASRTGWPVFDPIWLAASGWCTVPGCGCPGRTDDPTASPPEPPPAPVVVCAPPVVATRLVGPCGAGTGPCGRTPTRPYACGPRCQSCAPKAVRGG